MRMFGHHGEAVAAQAAGAAGTAYTLSTLSGSPWKKECHYARLLQV
jgi:isopentenyl diphosphate isomerase/L-lactate dehydrogenase-like FMN-dependent dehydrogenase